MDGGAVISFSGPGSGASINPAVATTTLNNSGVASITVVANGLAGSYGVAATAVGVGSPATFALTNTGTITLHLSKVVELTNTPAEIGDTITYTIRITNSGNIPAENVTVQDTLPTGVSGSNLDETVTIINGTSLRLP